MVARPLQAEAALKRYGGRAVIDDPDLNGWVPNAGSPVLGAGDSSTGADFMGAVGDEDWTQGGWTDFPSN